MNTVPQAKIKKKNNQDHIPNSSHLHFIKKKVSTLRVKKVKYCLLDRIPYRQKRRHVNSESIQVCIKIDDGSFLKVLPNKRKVGEGYVGNKTMGKRELG